MELKIDNYKVVDVVNNESGDNIWYGNIYEQIPGPTQWYMTLEDAAKYRVYSCIGMLKMTIPIENPAMFTVEKIAIPDKK